jgi:hypothetical protein
VSTKPGGQPDRGRVGRRLVGIGFAVVPAVIVGAALAVAGGEGRPGVEEETGEDRPAVERVAPGLPTLVGAFRRSQTDADKIPGGDPLQSLRQLGLVYPGENPLLSRRLEMVGGHHAYLWPASDAVCYAWGGASVCSSTSFLAQKGVLIGTSGDGGPEVDAFALASDGVPEVRFTLEDGREIVARVQNNGALVRLPAAPLDARWRSPDGTAGSQRLSRD